MDIKEEGPINVVTSHLPKMSFIPTDVRRLPQAVEAGGEAEEAYKQCLSDAEVSPPPAPKEQCMCAGCWA